MAIFDEIHQVKYAVISADGGTDIQVAAVTGKAIVVLSYLMSAAGATVVKWQSKPSGAAVELSGQGLALAANGSVSAAYSPSGLLATASGAALQLTLSAAEDVGGHLTYVEL